MSPKEWNMQQQRDRKHPACQPCADKYADAYLQLKFAYESTLEIFTANSQQQIVDSLGRVLGALLPTVGCAFLLRDPTNGVLYAAHQHGFRADTQELLDQAVDTEIAEWALAQGRIATLPLNLGLQEAKYTGLWVPLDAHGDRFGLLFIVLDMSPEEITEIEYNLLYVVATQSALALESRRLIENTEIQAEAIRNMKAYLESVLECMPSGLIASDLEGRITLMNSSAGRMLHVDPDEATGLTFSEVLRPDIGHSFSRALQALREGKETESVEIELGNDEDRLPVRLVPSPLRNEEGQPVGVIFVLIDLREERELSELRRLDQLKDQFVSAVSHELRTPITAIKSFAEILLEYDDPEHRREFLEIINRESDRLARLVNDILDLSKIEAGMMRWEIEDFDLRQAIGQAIDSVKVLAQEKNIELIWENPEEPLYVRADRERLVQVIVNLLSNAVKFTPEGGKVIVGHEVLEGRRSTDRGDYVKVWVKDTGIGIPKHYLPIIFDRFQQVVEGKGLTNRPKGTGLGLPISKEIVEHLGGNMGVESEEGKGSTFYFTVPLAPKVKEVKRFATTEVTVREA